MNIAMRECFVMEILHLFECKDTTESPLFRVPAYRPHCKLVKYAQYEN